MMKTSKKSPPRDILGFFKNFTYLANEIIDITKTSCNYEKKSFLSVFGRMFVFRGL